MKSDEKFENVGKSGEKLENVGKSGERWGKKWGKVGKSREKANFRSQFLPFQIDTQLFFVEIFGQNGRQRPFWIGRQCQLSNSSEIFG